MSNYIKYNFLPPGINLVVKKVKMGMSLAEDLKTRSKKETFIILSLRRRPLKGDRNHKASIPCV